MKERKLEKDYFVSVMIYTKLVNKITVCHCPILSATFKGMGNNPMKLWWLIPHLYKNNKIYINHVSVKCQTACRE